MKWKFSPRNHSKLITAYHCLSLLSIRSLSLLTTTPWGHLAASFKISDSILGFLDEKFRMRVSILGIQNAIQLTFLKNQRKFFREFKIFSIFIRIDLVIIHSTSASHSESSLGFETCLQAVLDRIDVDNVLRKTDENFLRELRENVSAIANEISYKLKKKLQACKTEGRENGLMWWGWEGRTGWWGGDGRGRGVGHLRRIVVLPSTQIFS